MPMYGYPAQPSTPSQAAVICRIQLQQAFVPTQEHTPNSQGFRDKDALQNPPISCMLLIALQEICKAGGTLIESDQSCKTP